MNKLPFAESMDDLIHQEYSFYEISHIEDCGNGRSIAYDNNNNIIAEVNHADLIIEYINKRTGGV